ncbi:MAG: hypothetical protein QM687_14640 [Ferruginibacter sp.]
MQFYKKNNWAPARILLLFIIVFFIAYLPVSSFLFFLKNDAFTGYFPPKFFLGESLHSGTIPFWNPYINFGYPLYGDMSSGIMSPVTWLIAAVFGYNAYSFTIETLLYILAGGIGMYKLTGHWKLQGSIRIIAGITFMCCGFQTGHLQHFNWLSGAAFIPWCLWSYLLLFERPSAKNILASVLFFYLLISSAHPGITIGAFYFFAAVTFFILLNKKEQRYALNKKKAGAIIIFFLLLMLVAAGLIVCYSDIIPHFIRGEKNSFIVSPSDSSSLPTWISLLLPLSVVKNEAFFQSDLSLRNSYIGLTSLLFFILALTGKKDRWQKFFLYTGLFFFILSIGGPGKALLYKIIPLTGYVRLNGEYRIFTLCCLIIVAAMQADKYFQRPDDFKKSRKRILYVLGTLLILSALWSIYKIILSQDSILFRLGSQLPAQSITGSLKFILDNTSFYDCMLLQALIQLVLLWQLTICLQKNNPQRLIKLVAVDMIIASLLIIPFTGAGKASVEDVQAVLNRSPKGIPLPPLQPIKDNSKISNIENDYIGSWSMYSKEIGTTEEVPYPIVLKNMRQFFSDSLRLNDTVYFTKAFVFFKNGQGRSMVKLTSFNANKITVLAESFAEDTLVLQQNNYPYWKAILNGKEVPLIAEGASFMSIPVGPGKNEVQFIFNPPAKIKGSLLFSAVLFSILLFAWMILCIFPRSSSLSSL